MTNQTRTPLLRGRRDGFALPMAVLLIGFMTAGVVAAFARGAAEVQLIGNQQAQTDAFAIAQAGLEAYIARGKVTPADTTIHRFGGSARVIVTEIRPAAVPADTAIYLFQSTGTPTQGAAQGALAARTVAQVAYLMAGTMQVLSSWSSLSGISKQGNSGTITGEDACTDDVLAGVAVPDGGFSGQTGPVEGDPPIDYMGSQDEMADSMKIDWAGITNPAAPVFQFDFAFCPGGYGFIVGLTPVCNGFPTAAWFTANPTLFPTVVINGSATLPTNGRGMLIVTGDLTLDGGDRWDGIILVGGRIIDNGNGGINGAVVTGLNVLKGETVGQSSRANGTKEYIYDSCMVSAAAMGTASLRQASNAWVDNWTSW